MEFKQQDAAIKGVDLCIVSVIIAQRQNGLEALNLLLHLAVILLIEGDRGIGAGVVFEI